MAQHQNRRTFYRTNDTNASELLLQRILERLDRLEERPKNVTLLPTPTERRVPAWQHQPSNTYLLPPPLSRAEFPLMPPPSWSNLPSTLGIDDPRHREPTPWTPTVPDTSEPPPWTRPNTDRRRRMIPTAPIPTTVMTHYDVDSRHPRRPAASKPQIVNHDTAPRRPFAPTTSMPIIARRDVVWRHPTVPDASLPFIARRDVDLQRHIISTNKDFTKLVKEANTICQLDQHTRNWQVLPGSLKDRIDNIVYNIRPPRPSDTTIARLEMAADVFKASVTKIVQSHLCDTREDVINGMVELNSTDLGVALETADRQMGRRLGKRLHRPTLMVSLSSVSKKLKKDQLTAIRLGTDGEPLLTHNRFDVLPIEDSDPETGVPPHPPQLEPLPQRQPKRTVPALIPTPTRLYVNRFNDDVATLKTSDLLLSCEDEVQSKERAATTTHTSAKRNKWGTTAPRPYHNTQIIADSNGKTWAEVALSAQWNLDSFSGMSLADVVPVLKRSEHILSTTIDAIVIAVGINDREMSRDVMLSTLQQIGQWRDKQDRNVFFVSTTIFNDFSMAQKKTLTFLNDTAKDIFGDCFINCCQDNQISPHPRNRSPGHYDVHTAEIIVQNVTSNLN
jgi:hypothetical protein